MATILVIEDDENLAELIADHLQKEGINTIIAYTGQSGIEHIDKDNPDCVSLDIHLPDISGVDILRRLRECGKKLSVIVVTSDDTVKKEVEKYEIEGFVRKPINFSELKKIIKIVLTKKEKE